MPGMPYHLEKGAWGAVFEDFLNGGETAERAVKTLYDLRNDVPLTELGFFRSPSLDDPTDHRYGGEGPDAADKRIRHFQIDWLGYQLDGTDLRRPEAWTDALTSSIRKDPPEVLRTWNELRRKHLEGPAPAPPESQRAGPGDLFLSDDALRLAALVKEAAVPPNEIFDAVGRYPETGFWHQYHGMVEDILRETFATVIEVALGLEWGQGSQLDELGLLEGREPPCRLPIEVFWKCPQRWFEGWVTWRTNGNTPASGQVTVILATPGSGTPLLERPGFGRNALVATGPMAKGEPAISFVSGSGGNGSLSPKGMWVVSHEDHVSLPPPNTWKARDYTKFEVPPFGPSYVGTGRVVVIEPSEAAGGVRRAGRPYAEQGPGSQRATKTATAPFPQAQS